MLTYMVLVVCFKMKNYLSDNSLLTCTALFSMSERDLKSNPVLCVGQALLESTTDIRLMLIEALCKLAAISTSS